MTSITLLYGNWCHYCKEFKPTWGKVKDWCRGKGIKATEYEDSQIQVMQSDPTKNTTGIPLDMIDGYPTIIIKRGVGDLTKVGDRSYKSILKLLGGEETKESEESIKPREVQKGGACHGNSCSFRKQTGGSHEEPLEVEPIMKQSYDCSTRKQDGGSVYSENYKDKYLMYKRKYLALKQQLHI